MLYEVITVERVGVLVARGKIRRKQNSLRIESGQDPVVAAQVVQEVARHTSLPMIVKLTPSVSDVRPIVEAVSDAGAQAITVAIV